MDSLCFLGKAAGGVFYSHPAVSSHCLQGQREAAVGRGKADALRAQNNRNFKKTYN